MQVQNSGSMQAAMQATEAGVETAGESIQAARKLGDAVGNSPLAQSLSTATQALHNIDAGTSSASKLASTLPGVGSFFAGLAGKLSRHDG